MSVYLDNFNVHERPQPIEQHEEVKVLDGKKIKRSALIEAVRHDVLATSAEFRDIFAFSIKEMLGIPPKVICHKLDIKSGYKPV